LIENHTEEYIVDRNGLKRRDKKSEKNYQKAGKLNISTETQTLFPNIDTDCSKTPAIIEIHDELGKK